jgi:hypothetical protein
MQKVVTFSEIMLRLATPGYQRFIQSNSLGATFGGGGGECAISLANYGIPNEANGKGHDPTLFIFIETKAALETTVRLETKTQLKLT